MAYSDGYEGDGFGGGKATVMKFNGTGREYVGLSGFSDGVVSSVSLSIYNGTPYVGYTDGYEGDGINEGKATVMKFTGTGWEAVGNS